MPEFEEIYDEFCPWPYSNAYGLVTRKVQKPKRKKAAVPRSVKRSWLAVDLATTKYRQRIVPNKKRKNDRSKVTLGGDE